MLSVVVAVHAWLLVVLARRDERGQAAAEYALVLLGAAGIALLVGKWADGTKLVARLLDVVLGNLLGRVR